MGLVLGVAALLLLAFLFCCGLKLSASAAPFAAIAASVLALALFAMLGLLRVGVVALLLAALFAPVLVFAIQKQKLKDALRAFLKPGVVFFIASCVFFGVVLSQKGAALRYWDEFSFWGTAAKVVFENDRLYTLVNTSMITVSYPPALPLLSYFLQFFNGAFSEWQLYFAYDILMMAAFALLFERCEWKNALSALALAAVSIFGLYFFWHTFEGMYVFANAYADIPLGVLFGAALLCWFRTREKKAVDFALVALSLALLVFSRDFGFALGLVACVVIAADMLLTKQYPIKRERKGAKKLLKLGWPLALFGVVVLSYVLWSVHFKLATSIDRVTIPYAYSALEIFTGKDPKFFEVTANMWQAIKTQPMAIFGTQLETAIVFFLLPIALGALTLDKKKLLRASLFSVLMALGLAVYYVFFSYLFTAIMPYSYFDTASFTRYLSSYYIGWFVAIAGVFAFDVARPVWRRFSRAPLVAFCAGVIAATLYFNPHHVDQYFVASPKTRFNAPAARAEIQMDCAPFAASLTGEDRFYVVSQRSLGEEWLWVNYELTRGYTVETLGGGNFVGYRVDRNNPAEHYNEYVTRQIFSDYLVENDVKYVYVQQVDDYFVEEFSAMFSDSLAGFERGETRVYRVVVGSAGVSFEPVDSLNE